jgi:hypothetical protein
MSVDMSQFTYTSLTRSQDPKKSFQHMQYQLDTVAQQLKDELLALLSLPAK